MLSISRVESLSHGLNYYKKDNYYINDGSQGEEYSLWFGKAAEEFGLKNEVNFKDFNRALLGVSKNGFLGEQNIKESDLYVSTAQINAFRQKAHSYLQTSHLSDDAKEKIYKSLFKLSARREKISKTSLAEYQKQISFILDKSNLSSSDSASIKQYFQKELKIFERKTTRRLAYDLTFSAPKSISLAVLVGDDKDLILAHRCAVQEALKTLETHYS